LAGFVMGDWLASILCACWRGIREHQTILIVRM